MKTVELYEVGDEVLIKAKIAEVSMDNGEIVYNVQSLDTGKQMGVWFRNSQLIPAETPSQKIQPV